MTEAPGRRVHVVVSGRVQGVGFRFFVVRHAQSLGLAGWVRNLADGRVELVAEGHDGAVAALVRMVRNGPARAEVTEVAVADSMTTDELPHPFDVW